MAISAGSGTVSDMDLEPTAEGSTIIAMPYQLTPGVKVLSVTDNAPAGGNTYKLVPGASSFCGGKQMDIWYCEKCNPGVTELKFHLSARPQGSLNGFLEVQGLEMSSVLDGEGVHLNDGTPAAGQQVGPKITTNASDFIVARYFTDPPMPAGVIPDTWKFDASYLYTKGPAGNYQPALTGGGSSGKFCMSIAAFKVAASTPASPPAPQK